MFWAYLTKTQKDKIVCNLIISYKKDYLYIYEYKNQKGQRKLQTMMILFTTLIVVMVSQVYTIIKIYQIIHLKYVQSIIH